MKHWRYVAIYCAVVWFVTGCLAAFQNWACWRFGVPVWVDAAIDGLLAGGTNALLLYIVMRNEYRRRQIVADVSHHVRNALYKIDLSLYGEHVKHAKVIDQGITEIEWALNHVLSKPRDLKQKTRR